MTQIEILKAFARITDTIVDEVKMVDEYPEIWLAWDAARTRLKELQDEPITAAWLRANGFAMSIHGQAKASLDICDEMLFELLEYQGEWMARMSRNTYELSPNTIPIRSLAYTHEVIALVEALTGKAWGETK